MGNTNEPAASAASSSNAGKSQLKEFSVVYTERATNLMDKGFRSAMQHDLIPTIKEAYAADFVIMIPGSGTAAMESVARQFALNQPCMIIRNGLFSFRWSAILDMAKTSVPPTVIMATADANAQYSPPAIGEVVKRIAKEKPKVVFAPHVETSTGIILPNDYVEKIGEACKAVDAVFVLDCIASGCAWINMNQMNVDVIITAPQKGWTAPAGSGVVCLSERGVEKLKSSAPPSTSFTLDLAKWHEVWTKYAAGEFMYHTTLPTDSLLAFRDSALETKKQGFDELRARQLKLGKDVRQMFKTHGLKSVAAPGYEAPGVVVMYTEKPDIVARFMAQGTQVAAAVPFKLDETAPPQTFRVGLFGLDKLANPEATLQTVETAFLAANAP